MATGRLQVEGQRERGVARKERGAQNRWGCDGAGGDVMGQLGWPTFRQVTSLLVSFVWQGFCGTGALLCAGGHAGGHWPLWELAGGPTMGLRDLRLLALRCQAVAVAVLGLAVGPGVQLVPPHTGIILLNPSKRHRWLKLEPPSESPISPGERSRGRDGHHPSRGGLCVPSHLPLLLRPGREPGVPVGGSGRVSRHSSLARRAGARPRQDQGLCPALGRAMPAPHINTAGD